MNIYDFDGTIYDGDSCKDLIKYALFRYPLLTIKSLKAAKKLNRDYEKGYIKFEEVKETMLSFIFKINNYPKFINKFVEAHMNKIKPWYLSRRRRDDVIVTASYELWISVFARKLGIKNVIATKTNMDGHIIGKNCKGNEKVNRIREIYPTVSFECSYSDSSVDIPMLKLSKHAYVVEGNKLITYKNGYSFKNNK